MIIRKYIKPPVISAFEPSGHCLGQLNEYEFNDLRIQIMKQQVSNYYVQVGGVRYYIDKDGRLPVWPDTFDLLPDQLEKLIQRQLGI